MMVGILRNPCNKEFHKIQRQPRGMVRKWITRAVLENEILRRRNLLKYEEENCLNMEGKEAIDLIHDR